MKTTTAATITTTDGKTLRRLSRWLKVQYTTVTPRHRLAEYADDGVLLFFNWRGEMFSIGQFYRLSGSWGLAPLMWYDDDGKLCHLTGVDSVSYYDPFFLEVDDGGEYVRLYREVKHP